MDSSSTEVYCSELVNELVLKFLQHSPVKPIFTASAKPRPNPNLGPPPGESNGLAKQVTLLTTSLEYVSTERDRWKEGCDQARNQLQQLHRENNRLAGQLKDLEETVAEQSSVCTTLAADLVEVIWSLSSKVGTVTEPIYHLQVIHLLKLTWQVLSQHISPEPTSSKAKEDSRLLVALLGCLVNLSSSPSTLSLILASLDTGHKVMHQVLALFLTSGDMRILEFTTMILYNVLNPHLEESKRVISLEQLKQIDVSASRLIIDPKTKPKVRNLVQKLKNLLQGDIHMPEQ